MRVSSAATNVSIIIPVLNDAPALRVCLAALSNSNVEIIVADGASDGAIAELCAAHPATYAASAPGRAVQMNAAAKLAHGEWLWFLHADSIPAEGSAAAISALDAGADWGCFCHRIDHAGIALRIIEYTDNLRARMGLPYGDQGIFVRRALFEQLGGYENVPILEDLLLARTLKQRCSPRVLPNILRSSARRWTLDGIVFTTATNWKILWRFFVRNNSIGEIAAFYRERRAIAVANCL